MRYIRPILGTRRIKKWFALLPVTIGNETRWMERVTISQEYMALMSPSGEPENGWKNMKFTKV